MVCLFFSSYQLSEVCGIMCVVTGHVFINCNVLFLHFVLNTNKNWKIYFHITVSGIGAVIKVVYSHLCGWGSIPGKSCSFLIVTLSKGLSLCFMCSDQHVKYRMPRGFPLTSSLLLDYHVKQYTQQTQTYIE